MANVDPALKSQLPDALVGGLFPTLGYVWDPVLLNYVVATPSTGGGGGGGAATIANGADVAEGATTDAESAAGNGSVIALLKRLRTLLSGTIAVSGTFWQATQPVSGPLTDAQLRASAVPTTGPLTDAQLRASAVPTTGPLTDSQLRASAVPIAVAIADGGDVVQGAKADAVWDGATVSTTFSAVLKYIGQKIEAVRALLAATLKIQERETGYANVSLYAEAVAGIIAETAISINKSVNYAAAAAATSNGPSAGKELVICGIIIGWVSTSTTANTCRLRIRVNPGGAAIITSPIALTMRIGWESATFIANEEELQPLFFNKPIIIPNGGQFMATLACVAANGTLDVQLIAYERTP
jgi:hypothetical protein